MSQRSIFISGANQGLGFEAAKQLASTPNIILFVGSRSLEAGQKAEESFKVDKTSKVVAVQLDITDQSSIDRAVETVTSELKKEGKEGLDCLVNNAGIAWGSFEEIYAVNVFGTSRLTTSFRPLIPSSPTSSIVNVSSTLGSADLYAIGKTAPIYFEYASSKSALNGMTAMLAYQEHEKKTGVRVVAICPGYNSTNLNKYQGTGKPEDGCKIIVEAALKTEGETGVFYDKNGKIAW